MENKGISRRTFNIGLAIAAIFAIDGPKAIAVHKFFSEAQAQSPSSYREAFRDPNKQEKWVRRILRQYSIENLFGDVIIVTPENADKYVMEYNRKEQIGPRGAALATVSIGKIEDIGTQRMPKPKLYVPTEAFTSTERDLTALIVYHEANHARVLRNGFGFVKMDVFKDKDNPQIFSNRIFGTVYELEGLKEHITKGASMMFPVALKNTRQDYLSYYIQLWRYGVNIREEVVELLKARYFMPWMRTVNSLWVYEESPSRLIKYGGKEQFPFIVSERVGNKEQYYIQFKFTSESGVRVIKLPVPEKILLTK